MEPAISELYRVFQPYRLGDDFTGCDHCVSQEDSQRLASIPLRELSVSDVDRYAFKAMTTWGAQRHFKHFLPRLLELAFDDYLAFNDPEVLLGKLAYAKWNEWPLPERDAVRNFLAYFWLHQLQLPGNFPTDDRVRTVLSGLAEACDSILPYLTAWADQRSLLPALHLSQLISDSAEEIMTTGSISLWGKPSLPCAELVAWLSSDSPRCLLKIYSEPIDRTFPLVRSQLDGIRAATNAW